MDTGEYIALDAFCRNYSASPTFINSMKEFGLIEIVLIEETEYILSNQLGEAEKLVRLFNDLEINTEGIDVVIQLLDRINNMQKEIAMLKQRLSFYEEED